MRFQALSSAFLTAAIVALGSGLGQPPAQSNPAPKGPSPQGCVSCHIQTPDGDHRLGASLAKLNHPAVSAVSTVPNDCLKCHRMRKPVFSQSIHKAHYKKGPLSEFNKKFNGECSQCHQMNGKTGVAFNKSGPRNW